MSTPINLLTVEVGGGYEVLEFDQESLEAEYESDLSEEVVMISGTLTVSP